jgi:hypothetical protein
MARLGSSGVGFVSILKETAMTRNHLLLLSLQPRPPARRSIWRMALDLLGHAFGAPARPERRR